MCFVCQKKERKISMIWANISIEQTKERKKIAEIWRRCQMQYWHCLRTMWWACSKCNGTVICNLDREIESESWRQWPKKNLIDNFQKRHKLFSHFLHRSTLLDIIYWRPLLCSKTMWQRAALFHNLLYNICFLCKTEDKPIECVWSPEDFYFLLVVQKKGNCNGSATHKYDKWKKETKKSVQLWIKSTQSDHIRTACGLWALKSSSSSSSPTFITYFYYFNLMFSWRYVLEMHTWKTSNCMLLWHDRFVCLVAHTQRPIHCL